MANVDKLNGDDDGDDDDDDDGDGDGDGDDECLCVPLLMVTAMVWRINCQSERL